MSRRSSSNGIRVLRPKSQLGDFSAEARKIAIVSPRVAARGDERAAPAEGLEPSRRSLKSKSVRAESLSCVRKQEYWHRAPDAGGKQRYRMSLQRSRCRGEIGVSRFVL